MVEKEEPKFPNIKAIEEFDREVHIRKAMEAGMTREEAERHVEDDLQERAWEDGHQ